MKLAVAALTVTAPVVLIAGAGEPDVIENVLVRVNVTEHVPVGQKSTAPEARTRSVAVPASQHVLGPFLRALGELMVHTCEKIVSHSMVAP